MSKLICAILLFLSFHESVFSNTFYYSGVGYLGSAQYIESAYPEALLINSDNKEENVLNTEFERALAKYPPEYIELSYTLADKDKGQTQVMSLSIDREYMSIEDLGYTHKVILEASAQILFIDFENLTLIASHPISVSINEIYDDIDSERISQLFRTLYLGSKDEEGLVQLAAKSLSSLNVNALSEGIRFQVSEVTVSEGATQKLSESTEQFRQFVGQYFTAELSRQYGLHAIPFVKGYTVGNVMAGRFSNGEVFNLSLPLPDYEFGVHVLAFKQTKKKQKPLMGYSSILNISLFQSELNKIYLDDDFFHIVEKRIGRSQKTIDDWAAYEDVLTELIDSFVSQLGKPSKKWINNHARDKDVYERFQAKATLFKT